MELLIRRGQKRGTFTLWVKFELTKEEERLVDQKGIYKIVLVPSDKLGDVLRSCFFSLPIVFVIGPILHALGMEILESFFAPLLLVACLMYKKISKRLTVLDLLNGHTFKAKNVAIVASLEEQINEWAQLFKQHLEASHEWGGKASLNLNDGKITHL
jgi:hypothetical protein